MGSDIWPFVEFGLGVVVIVGFVWVLCLVALNWSD